MELIIDFYNGLDTLNLIIFWGIIIVIILLLVFSIVLINKNKKLKKLVEDNNKIEEEIPILKEEITPIEEETTIISESVQEIEEIEIIEEEPKIELEEVKEIPPKKENKPIEMPTGPYQRNVLREMSLSQTSPIGINRKPVEEPKKPIINDLEESLNIEIENNEVFLQEYENKSNQINEQIKNDLTNIAQEMTRKTEIVSHYEPQTLPQELLNMENIEKEEEANTSEKYLEDVSKKLSEAEIPNEIERTSYEMQQEEDAIISYKELMEKKDSIQTIDEEDAVISIEELMTRSNQTKEQTPSKEEQTKLYNLTDKEENDDFINELKQFRKDL